MNETKAKPVQFPYCNACGSAGVISDASARWCISAQEWDLSGVQDYECCDACGGEDIAWASVPTENLAECQNCGEAWHIDHVKEAQDLAQRVSPGEIVPAGECPSCGALCQLWKPSGRAKAKPDSTNAHRATRAQFALDHYKKAYLGESGPIDEDTVSDILADIMHHCREAGLSWEDLARVATDNFAAECAEPGPALDAVREAETAYAENRDNDELQIDRANPAALIMHDAVWVRSWTRVRPVGDGAQ